MDAGRELYFALYELKGLTGFLTSDEPTALRLSAAFALAQLEYDPNPGRNYGAVTRAWKRKIESGAMRRKAKALWAEYLRQVEERERD